MSRSEKTLVILTPGFPSSETDYNCLPMQQSFVKSFKKKYPQLNIIILTFQYPYFKKKYNWYGNTVISFSGRNRRGFSKLLLRRKINAALKKINGTNEIIGMISFWCSECAYVGKKFADKYALKHFCWILGQDAKKENDYVKKINPRPNELIALSDFLQDEFEKNHSIRPDHVIPPGIDIENFPEKNLEKDIDIIGVGSLIPLKQYDAFIEIIYELKEEIPRIRAMICGNGPEEKKLETLRNKLGLENNILITGELPHHEVLLLMQRSRILLHTSSYEGYGVVCLEALYSGANVVRLTRAMKQDIKNCYITSSKQKIKQIILNILQDPDMIYERVLTHSMSDIAKKMMALFGNDFSLGN